MFKFERRILNADFTSIEVVGDSLGKGDGSSVGKRVDKYTISAEKDFAALGFKLFLGAGVEISSLVGSFVGDSVGRNVAITVGDLDLVGFVVFFVTGFSEGKVVVSREGSIVGTSVGDKVDGLVVEVSVGLHRGETDGFVDSFDVDVIDGCIDDWLTDGSLVGKADECDGDREGFAVGF